MVDYVKAPKRVSLIKVAPMAQPDRAQRVNYFRASRHGASVAYVR